jgi:alanine racemase
MRFVEREALLDYPVHIEVETGMNRLGFAKEDLPALGKLLERETLRIQSVFSHLAASEDASHDAFTKMQSTLFAECCSIIASSVHYPFLRHLANTAAVTRHPDVQLDMVRIGIGLYGIDPHMNGLRPVTTLTTTVAQVKRIAKGDSVGYSRTGSVQRDAVIATLRIGYADGYPRSLGEGKGAVWIRGSLAPVIGAVCMDMTMVDVTDIPGVEEGDQAVLFGSNLAVADLAAKAGTISYDIISGISQRVNRVFIEE